MTAHSSDRAAAIDAPVRRPSRAGRNLPAAIAVGAGLGAVMLGLAAVRAAPVRRGARAGSTAVGDLGAGGCAAPGRRHRRPLPVLLVGGQAMVWLAWPFGLAGLAIGLRRDRAGRAAVADAGRGRALSSATSPPASSPRPTWRCSARSPPCWWSPRTARAGVDLPALRGRLRHRWLRGRGAGRQAPDGPDDQPEEVLGGIRRLAGRRDGRRALCVALLLGRRLVEGPAARRRCW